MLGEGRVPWWQTVPAILTGLAGVFGALAGLLAILYQVGFFSPKSEASIVLKKSDAAPKTEHSPSVAEIFQQFDLFGAWAANCDKDASPENVHVIIARPASGPVIEIHDLGSGFALNRYTIVSAKRIDVDTLTAQTVFSPGTSDQEINDLVWRVRNGTRQTISNQPEGRSRRVNDGILVRDGKSIPTIHKCS